MRLHRPDVAVVDLNLPGLHGIELVRRIRSESVGTKVIIVEDVVTTGGSSMKAVNRAKEEGLDVLGIVTLVDREEGGRENIEAEGYWLKALFVKSELVA